MRNIDLRAEQNNTFATSPVIARAIRPPMPNTFSDNSGQDRAPVLPCDLSGAACRTRAASGDSASPFAEHGSRDRPRGSGTDPVVPKASAPRPIRPSSLVPSPKWSLGSPADWKLPPPNARPTRARPPAVTDDHGADPVAVRCRPLEAKREEVTPAPRRLRIVEIDQRLVLRDHHRVEPAVVVEVADGQPAADVELLERRAGAAP